MTVRWFIWVVSIGLAACGQTGSLYLPGNEQNGEAVEQSEPGSDQQNQEEKDRERDEQ